MSSFYPGRWRYTPLRRVEVEGDSMRPALEPGDRLLVVAGRRGLRPGDVVAVRDPRAPAVRTMVKRVSAVGPDGVSVLGDSPEASTDSRTFGPVPGDLVVGRAVYRYWPDHRRGRVARRIGTL